MASRRNQSYNNNQNNITIEPVTSSMYGPVHLRSRNSDPIGYSQQPSASLRNDPLSNMDIIKVAAPHHSHLKSVPKSTLNKSVNISNLNSVTEPTSTIKLPSIAVSPKNVKESTEMVPLRNSSQKILFQRDSLQNNALDDTKKLDQIKAQDLANQRRLIEMYSFNTVLKTTRNQNLQRQSGPGKISPQLASSLEKSMHQVNRGDMIYVPCNKSPTGWKAVEPDKYQELQQQRIKNRQVVKKIMSTKAGDKFSDQNSDTGQCLNYNQNYSGKNHFQTIQQKDYNPEINKSAEMPSFRDKSQGINIQTTRYGPFSHEQYVLHHMRKIKEPSRAEKEIQRSIGSIKSLKSIKSIRSLERNPLDKGDLDQQRASGVAGLRKHHQNQNVVHSSMSLVSDSAVKISEDPVRKTVEFQTLQTIRDQNKDEKDNKPAVVQQYPLRHNLGNNAYDQMDFNRKQSTFTQWQSQWNAQRGNASVSNAANIMYSKK